MLQHQIQQAPQQIGVRKTGAVKRHSNCNKGSRCKENRQVQAVQQVIVQRKSNATQQLQFPQNIMDMS
jgi:hypothetical protein